MIGVLIFYGLMVTLSVLFLKNSGIISLPMPDFFRETSDTIIGYLDSFEIPSKLSNVKSQIALLQPALSPSTSYSQLNGGPSDILTNLKDSVTGAIQQPPALPHQQQEQIISSGQSALDYVASIALQQYHDKIHDTVIEPSSHFFNVWVLTPLVGRS
ncbi:unnamed protein product [Ambrosiozyma monospora]|uniref:Unnamed protein product n=1 Tax=Ambrosiozyma monospora TaxID=43982 RepID=A0ACB5U9I0_AMBMO|nr:unnamed protein product [Ambrosiozyma monospora]